MNNTDLMPLVKANHQIGTDDLVTMTICGVFIFTLWKLKENRIEQKVSTNEMENAVVPKVVDTKPFSSITDCFGDVIYANPLINESPHRIGTPFSECSDTTTLTIDTTDTKDKWEIVDSDEEHFFDDELS